MIYNTLVLDGPSQVLSSLNLTSTLDLDFGLGLRTWIVTLVAKIE